MQKQPLFQIVAAAAHPLLQFCGPVVNLEGAAILCWTVTKIFAAKTNQPNEKYKKMNLTSPKSKLSVLVGAVLLRS